MDFLRSHLLVVLEFVWADFSPTNNVIVLYIGYSDALNQSRANRSRVKSTRGGGGGGLCHPIRVFQDRSRTYKAVFMRTELTGFSFSKESLCVLQQS
jgi:hypothetical protein